MSGCRGRAGFVGEFLSLAGAWQVSTLAVVGAATGVILSAGYALWLYRRVVFGDLIKQSLAQITDMNRREVTVFAPLVVATLLFGVYPSLALDLFQGSTEALVEAVAEARLAAADTGLIELAAQ